jgi:AcrR family transcriptional regulator
MVQKIQAPTASKADAKRRAILRAAAGVFRKRGLADAGMRDIARAAQLSPGNLYYYFRDKSELVFFCQAEALDRMLGAAVALEGGPLPAARRLSMVIAAHIDATLNEVDGAAAHTDVEVLSPPLRRRITAKRDRYERAVRRIIADGIHRKEFRECDPGLVTRAILGALNWTSRWYDPGGPLSPGAVADEFADYLVKGLAR